VSNFCLQFINEIFISEVDDIKIKFEGYLIKSNICSNEDFARKEATRIFNSFLIVWEFLDRGMKGFLTGDLSYHLIKNAKSIIEKFMIELQNIEKEFQKIGIDPQDFYESFFKIDQRFYKNNKPNQLVLDLSKYFESQGVSPNRLLYFVNIKHTQFFDLFKSKIAKIKIKEEAHGVKLNDEQIKNYVNEKKKKVQQILNDMYNEITDTGIVNPLKTPFYGILHPDKENQHNLFRRQLLIEEGTFERANEDFIKIFNNLQDIGQAHEMFFNRKMLTKWYGSLNYAIAEYQKLVIDGSELNKKSNEFLKYFIALPSSEISILCLLHILKLIINNMSLKPDEKQSDERYLKILKEIDINEDEFEIEIPLVSFAEDLGKLFFTELRNTKIEQQFENPNARLYVKSLSANMINFEVTKKEKIKLGVLLTNILIRNIFYDKNEDPNRTEHLKVLKILQKNIDVNKSQNFLVIDKDFVSKYYVRIIF
jgi:hypothetical protein